jgi:type II secretion system protein F
MPDFKYTALDRAGKQVTGTLTGGDKSDAAAKVRALGYFPVELSSSNGSGNGVGRQVVGISGGLTRPNIDGKPRTADQGTVAPLGKKVGRVHILLFTRELSDLIDAGLPIDRALSVLLEQSDNEALHAMIQKLQADIRSGNALSDALRSFPREFPSLYANMIHAGEVSGQLAPVLTRLADFLEKEQVRRSQVLAALTYPMVLISVALLAVTFLLTYVIPKLNDVFKQLGTGLPLPTQILLGVSHALMTYWYVFLAVIGGTLMLYRAWSSTPGGRTTIDTLKLNAPLFGGLTHKIVMARFVRTLGTLMGGGVPILDSLEISGNAVGNVVTTQAVEVARDGVRQGETLAHSLGKTGRFLPLVVHMTAVGEETGRLPGMLGRTADTLDFEVDNAMRRLTSLVEPLVVLLMGTFVGFVVLSILLPIFEANSNVK